MFYHLGETMMKSTSQLTKFLATTLLVGCSLMAHAEGESVISVVNETDTALVAVTDCDESNVLNSKGSGHQILVQPNTSSNVNVVNCSGKNYYVALFNADKDGWADKKIQACTPFIKFKYKNQDASITVGPENSCIIKN